MAAERCLVDITPLNTECIARIQSYVKVSGKRLLLMLKVLKSFEFFTKFTEKNSFFTLAGVPHKIHKFLSTTLAASKHDGQAEAELKKQLLSAMTERFGFVLSDVEKATEVNLALRAAALHPKYGKLPWVSDKLRDLVWQAVAADAAELLLNRPVVSV